MDWVVTLIHTGKVWSGMVNIHAHVDLHVVWGSYIVALGAVTFTFMLTISFT